MKFCMGRGIEGNMKKNHRSILLTRQETGIDVSLQLSGGGTIIMNPVIVRTWAAVDSTSKAFQLLKMLPVIVTLFNPVLNIFQYLFCSKTTSEETPDIPSFDNPPISRTKFYANQSMSGDYWWYWIALNIVVHRKQHMPFLLVSGAIYARLVPYFGWISFHVQRILQ